LKLWQAVERRARAGLPVGVEGLRAEWDVLRRSILQAGGKSAPGMAIAAE